MQVLHVLPRHRVDVLAPQRVLHDQLVKLLYLVARRERSGEEEEEEGRIELSETGWRMPFPKCIFNPTLTPRRKS